MIKKRSSEFGRDIAKLAGPLQDAIAKSQEKNEESKSQTLDSNQCEIGQCVKK
jgi:hypothetical protein